MRECSCCLPVQAERGIAVCLLGLLHCSMAQVGRSCWLQPRLDGAPLDVSQPRDVVLPARGMLTLGLADLRDVPAGAQPLSQQQLEGVLQVGWAWNLSDASRAKPAAFNSFTLLVSLIPLRLLEPGPTSLNMLHGGGLGKVVLAA